MENNYTVDIISLTVAIIAVIVAGYSILISKQINKNQLRKEFFMEVFKEDMLLRYPQTINKLISSKGDVAEICDKLEEINTNLIERVIIYKVIENDFYKKIYSSLQTIDECVTYVLADKDDAKKNRESKIEKIESSYKNLTTDLNKFYMKV